MSTGTREAILTATALVCATGRSLFDEQQVPVSVGEIGHSEAEQPNTDGGLAGDLRHSCSQGPRAWIDDQLAAFLQRCLACMCISARSPPSNVLMIEPAWDSLSVQWARRSISRWSKLARLRYRS